MQCPICDCREVQFAHDMGDLGRARCRACGIVYEQSPCLTGETECTVRFDLNWLLLARQKAFLVSLMQTYGDGLLDGVVELIDHIQVTAEQEGQPVVWATEYDKERHG